MAEQCGTALYNGRFAFEGGEAGEFNENHPFSSFSRRVHMLEGEHKGLDYNSLTSFIKGEKVPCYKSYSNSAGEAVDFFVVPRQMSFKVFGAKKLEITKVPKGSVIVAAFSLDGIKVLSRAQFVKAYVSAGQYVARKEINEMFGKIKTRND